MRNCPHTGRELATIPSLGPDYGVCRAGAVHFLKAKSIDYGPDYFLEEYRKQYGRSYLEDEEALRRLARRRLDLLPGEPGRLLEIGCALGFFLDEARELGYETEGLEISGYAAEYAREKLKLNVRRDSFPDFHCEPRYDVVAAFYVGEHFADQKAFFQKVASLLREGGSFLFAYPSTNGPLFQCRRAEWVASHPGDHFADYSPASLKKILPLYGLELSRVRPSSYHPERACSWRRLLRPFYRSLANLNCYGDTMEGVARRKKR